MKFIKLILGVILLFPTINYAQYFEGTITYRTTIISNNELTHMMFDTLNIVSIKDIGLRKDKYAAFNNQTYLVVKDKEYWIDSIKHKIRINDTRKGFLDSLHIRCKTKEKLNSKILSYNCKYYFTRSRNGSYMGYWVTDLIKPNVSGAAFFIKNKGIILKSHFKSNDGKLELIKEAILIDFKPIDPRLFDIPKDYEIKQVDMGKKVEEYIDKYGGGNE